MERSRIIGASILLLSIGGLGLSAWTMSQRAVAFNQAHQRPHFKKEQIIARSFNAHDRKVSLVDGADADGDAVLKLAYGDAARDIPVKKPAAENLPGLDAYGDWLAMLWIAPVDQIGRPLPGQTPADTRFVLVVRDTPEGFDPESWGSVRRKEWTFRFYELKPDGTISLSRFRWPLPESMMNFAAAKAELAGDAEKVEQAKRESMQKKIDRLPEEIRDLPELKEQTFEWEAALHAIPRLSVPNFRFKNTALQWQGTGWTFAAASISVMGVLLGIGMLMAPNRSRGPGSDPPAEP